MAQHTAAQLLTKQGQKTDKDKEKIPTTERFQEIALDTLELMRPRSVGVEHAALMTLRDLGLEQKLTDPRVKPEDKPWFESPTNCGCTWQYHWPHSGTSQ
jgi:hypothetical protein